MYTFIINVHLRSRFSVFVLFSGWLKFYDQRSTDKEQRKRDVGPCIAWNEEPTNKKTVGKPQV